MQKIQPFELKYMFFRQNATAYISIYNSARNNLFLCAILTGTRIGVGYGEYSHYGAHMG